MKAIYTLLLFSISLSIYAQDASDNDKKAIMKVLTDQQKAWNNGDITAFMEGYKKDEHISFTGKNGISYGWQNIYDNYMKGYPDSETMGQLKFEIRELKELGKDHYMMLGKFILSRTNDQPSGFFTLIFERDGADWKIIADHTSA